MLFAKLCGVHTIMVITYTFEHFLTNKLYGLRLFVKCSVHFKRVILNSYLIKFMVFIFHPLISVMPNLSVCIKLGFQRISLGGCLNIMLVENIYKQNRHDMGGSRL